MSDSQLGLAVNGREKELETKLVAFPVSRQPSPLEDGGRPAFPTSVCVVGLGYVGLPTALALRASSVHVTGIDISLDRLRAIRSGEVDVSAEDRVRLSSAMTDDGFQITDEPAAVSDADAVIICVPTPVDGHLAPDLVPLEKTCSSVAAHARPGQTIILTSTTYVGTTRDLLVRPLLRRGLEPGRDVHVVYSPERIDPGNENHEQSHTPRVVGGVTEECARRGAQVIGLLTQSVYLVSSLEAAEMTKLYENVFRAVTLALANEFADAAGSLGLDPIEVTIAAATKPYGFLAAFPGPGVGGHCIPCDPHYLLWQLRSANRDAPLIRQAMESIATRPGRVVERVVEVLAETGRDLAASRVLVVGVSYKPGVRDLRMSPAIEIITELAGRGADVCYHDPLIPSVHVPGRGVMHSDAVPRGADWDLVLIHTVHPGVDYSWANDCAQILDATYLFEGAAHRRVV